MFKSVIVKRKNGVEMPWVEDKIKKAVRLSALTIQKAVSEDLIESIPNLVFGLIQDKYKNVEEKEVCVTVSEIHDTVIHVLKSLDTDLYNQYRDYRNYKQRYTKSFETIKDDTMRVVYSGDKENANKDSSIISTQKELISGIVSQEMMLEWEIPVDARKKHKDGLIYIHDLRDHIYDSINCCLFDLGSVIKGGFELNGIKIEEPETFETFMDLANDIMLVASSQQFGGFTFPEIDTVGAPYLRKTFNRIKEELLSYGLDEVVATDKAYERTWNVALKKCRMYEYKVNCVNNCTGYCGSLI